MAENDVVVVVHGRKACFKAITTRAQLKGERKEILAIKILIAALGEKVACQVVCFFFLVLFIRSIQVTGSRMVCRKGRWAWLSLHYLQGADDGFWG